MASQDRDNGVIVSKPDSVVELAKKSLSINEGNGFLDDKQIANICRWIGERAPDDKVIDINGHKFSRAGVEAMLFISIMEFPSFYERMGLSQLN